MEGQRVDRTAWAQVIAELIESETRGKKAPFARLVDVDSRTVYRWLHEEVDVSEENVRSVARHLNRPPMDLLIQAGYYRREDLAASPDPATAEPDPEMQLILEAPITSTMKKALIERLLQMRDQDRTRREEQIRWSIDQAKEA